MPLRISRTFRDILATLLDLQAVWVPLGPEDILSKQHQKWLREAARARSAKLDPRLAHGISREAFDTFAAISDPENAPGVFRCCGPRCLRPR
jgi:hypothetical protein